MPSKLVSSVRYAERYDEAYKGHYSINANFNTAPQIGDRGVKPILDRNEVYSGCYARVSLIFYAFNSNGKKEVACGLGNIQKVRDGEPLGGRTNTVDDFVTLDDDDFLARYQGTDNRMIKAGRAAGMSPSPGFYGGDYERTGNRY